MVVTCGNNKLTRKQLDMFVALSGGPKKVLAVPGGYSRVHVKKKRHGCVNRFTLPESNLNLVRAFDQSNFVRTTQEFRRLVVSRLENSSIVSRPSLLERRQVTDDLTDLEIYAEFYPDALPSLQQGLSIFMGMAITDSGSPQDKLVGYPASNHVYARYEKTILHIKAWKPNRDERLLLFDCREVVGCQETDDCITYSNSNYVFVPIVE